MPDIKPEIDKTIHCIACGKIIAQGFIVEGAIRIKCPHCKVYNKIKAENKPEGRIERKTAGT